MIDILRRANEILVLSGTANTNGKNWQEDEFEDILMDLDAEEIIPDNKQIRGVCLRNLVPRQFYEQFRDGVYYMREPFGSQQSPDFIVFYYGFCFFIECKSSKNEKIMWNCAISRRNWIYIVRAKDHRGLFLGSHFISENQESAISRYWEEVIRFGRGLWSRISDEYPNLQSSRNQWEPYNRKMNNHKCNFAEIDNHFEDVVAFVNEVIDGEAQHANECQQ